MKKFALSGVALLAMTVAANAQMSISQYPDAGTISPTDLLLISRPNGSAFKYYKARVPFASPTVAGTVKVGSGLAIAADGTLSSTGQFLEYDPIFTASSWYTTANNSGNWNTAYGWGNHANAGYALLSQVSTAGLSGSYADLTGKPTLGALASQDSVTSSQLPKATATTIGGVSIGTGLNVDASGVLSASSTGSGTVNSGTQTQVGFYNANGTAISGTSSITVNTGGAVGVNFSGNDGYTPFTINAGGSSLVNQPAFRVLLPVGGYKGFQITNQGDSYGWASFEYNVGGAGFPGLLLGPGGAVRDTSIYRSAVNQMTIGNGSGGMGNLVAGTASTSGLISSTYRS